MGKTFNGIYRVSDKIGASLYRTGLAQLVPIKSVVTSSGVLQSKGATVIVDISMLFNRHAPIIYAWAGQERVRGLPYINLSADRPSVGLPSRDGVWVSMIMERDYRRQPREIKLLNLNPQVAFDFSTRDEIIVVPSVPNDINWQLRNGARFYTPNNIGL